jgi:hypothetical protein
MFLILNWMFAVVLVSGPQVLSDKIFHYLGPAMAL